MQSAALKRWLDPLHEPLDEAFMPFATTDVSPEVKCDCDAVCLCGAGVVLE